MLLGVEPGSAVALDFDLACSKRLLEFENNRDFKRLESLVKSFAVLYAGMLGGDAEKVAESFRNEAQESPEFDDDDPDIW